MCHELIELVGSPNIFSEDGGGGGGSGDADRGQTFERCIQY